MALSSRIASTAGVSTLMTEVPHHDASVVSTPNSCMVVLLLSSPRFLVAGIAKDIREPSPEQRAQGRQAGGDDSQIGLERREARPPRLHEADLRGLVVFLGEHAKPHDPESGDP